MVSSLKLTENEKKVLKELVRDSRLTDTKIAESISITQQAVYQIRCRLESLGVVEGYRPIINFKKLGLNVICVMGIVILPDMWAKFKEHEINKKILDLPFSLKLIRLSSGDVSYILISCFKNIEERERFLSKIESELSKMVSIEWSYTTYVDNFVEQFSFNNLSYALSEKDIDFMKVAEKIAKK